VNRTTETPRTGLADLVEDVGFFHAEVWGRRSHRFSPGIMPQGLAIADIWNMLECGLLVDPYFTVVKDGVPVRATQTRIVLQRPVPDYADGASVRRLVDDGHVLKINQPEDFDLDVRHLLDDARTRLRAGVQAQFWLCPPRTEFIDSPDPQDHTFVLQLEGQATWYTSTQEEFFLQPGDLLYVPSYQGYRASSQELASLFLTFTAQPPSAVDIAELALAYFLQSAEGKKIEGTHHRMTPAEKTDWLRAELGAYLASLDVGALLEDAVRIRQREGRA
jgi:hypothetical protein